MNKVTMARSRLVSQVLRNFGSSHKVLVLQDLSETSSYAVAGRRHRRAKEGAKPCYYKPKIDTRD